jgi:hypothetical protein
MNRPPTAGDGVATLANLGMGGAKSEGRTRRYFDPGISSTTLTTPAPKAAIMVDNPLWAAGDHFLPFAHCGVCMVIKVAT